MKVGRETDERREMEGKRDDNVRRKGLHGGRGKQRE